MFDSYIAFHARSRPKAPAVVALGDTVSFETFDQDINRAVFELSDLHAAAGEAVSIAVASPYLQWVLILALARRGIATAPSADKAARQRIGDGTDRPEAVTRLLDAEAIARIVSGPAQVARPVQADRTALARILQSSGTTGEQKRVGMSWNVIDAAIRNALIAYGAPDGPWLASTGIGTILGVVMTLACWASGNAAVLGLDGNLKPENLAVLRPRLISLVPDQLQRLIDALPQDHQPGPLRIISGGGPVSPALARKTRLRLTDDLRSVYGSSETGAVAIADIALLEQDKGGTGYVLPMVDVAILDQAGQPLPAGTLGQVRIRSDRVADHFFGTDSPAALGFVDGWFLSNDLGRLSEDGQLVIEGRMDDLMNLGGHKILPAWVEQAALACDGVRDAAAFSFPDEDGIEHCSLAIVAAPGLVVSRLVDALQVQLKWLENIQVLPLDEIPRNHMGKVQRDRLRAIGRRGLGG